MALYTMYKDIIYRSGVVSKEAFNTSLTQNREYTMFFFDGEGTIACI